MRFDRSRHSKTELAAARQYYQATRQFGAFEGILAQMVGDYERSTHLTMDLIWALDDTLAVLAAPGDTVVKPILACRLSRQLTLAVGSLLHDYQVALSVPAVLIRDLTGYVRVRGDHAMRATIEALLNGSSLLSEAIGVLLDIQHQVIAVREPDRLPTLTLVDRGQGITIVPPGMWSDGVGLAPTATLSVG